MSSRVVIAANLALALGACASAPQPNAELERARSTVAAAEANPTVNQYSAVDLQDARNQLAAAEYASAKHQDAQVAQPAYLATQSALIAQAHAAAKADDAKVAAGQAERDQIRLAARTAEAQQAKAKAASLQEEVDQLNAKSTSRGLVLTLGDVLFETGKADLNSGATRKLDQLAQFLMEHPDRRVQVDGFTDSVGSDSYNLDLSQRRADAVKSALLSRGIDPARISTQGYAKAFPVASNAEASGRQLNRRVEVVIGGEHNSQITPRS
jgi:outer membrane protein OmpA-like peptidoglycan-associated protein